MQKVENGNKCLKSQVIHVHNPQKARSSVDLKCCDQTLDYVSTYKYLGFLVNEFVSPNPAINALTASASRSFGQIVSMFKKMQNMGINSFNTLYNTYVLPTMPYGAGVWGYKEQHETNVLQN